METIPNPKAKRKSNDGLAIERLRLWRREPDTMVRELFRATPDRVQKEALRAFGDPDCRRIAMRASTGTGKTTTEAWCVWNYYLTRPNPKGAATSITWPNLRDNLWSELAKWRDQSDLLKKTFEWTQHRIYLREKPEQVWFTARTWSRDSTPEQQALTLSGLHGDFCLAIVDEAGGIPDAVVEAGERMLSTTRHAKLMVNGNPTHLSGPLFRAFTRDQKMYRLFHMTSDPADPNRSPRVDPQWAQEQIDRHGGRDEFYVRVFILGLFPLGETDGLIPLGRIDEAYQRYEQALAGAIILPRGPKTIGVDVSRFGGDKTVVTLRDGAFVEGYREWHKQDTEYTADEVRRIFDEFSLWKAPHDKEPRPVASINVDDIGVGGGVTDKLARRELPVAGIDVGSAATDSDRYKNLRAELGYGELRLKYFVPGAIALHPSFRETSLSDEASSLQYKFAEANVIALEPKDAYRKRKKKSPDFFDSLMLAYATRGVDLEQMGWH